MQGDVECLLGELHYVTVDVEGTCVRSEKAAVMTCCVWFITVEAVTS